MTGVHTSMPIQAEQKTKKRHFAIFGGEVARSAATCRVRHLEETFVMKKDEN